MQPYMIPISTAKWDPSWFYMDKYQGYVWKDKNGVYNGIRAEEFAPGSMCSGLCQGKDGCKSTPDQCIFLKTYAYQLNQLNYSHIIRRCELLSNSVKQVEQFKEEPIIIFLVHESPDNPCSERIVIQNWFAANGQKVKEWINPVLV